MGNKMYLKKMGGNYMSSACRETACFCNSLMGHTPRPRSV